MPRATKRWTWRCFEKFCEEHPFFVRRLKEKLNYSRPEQVVEFLADNRKIPSLYVEDAEQAAAWRQGEALRN